MGGGPRGHVPLKQLHTTQNFQPLQICQNQASQLCLLADMYFFFGISAVLAIQLPMRCLCFATLQHIYKVTAVGVRLAWF